VIYLEDSLVKRNREFVEWTRGKTGKQTEPNRESAHGVMRRLEMIRKFGFVLQKLQLLVERPQKLAQWNLGALIFLLTFLFQSYPWSAIVLVDELDRSVLECEISDRSNWVRFVIPLRPNAQ
jgi:hypothetical protein